MSYDIDSEVDTPPPFDLVVLLFICPCKTSNSIDRSASRKRLRHISPGVVMSTFLQYRLP